MAAYLNYQEPELTTLISSTPVIQPGLSGWDVPYEVKTFKENEVIFKQGDLASGIYLLKTGAAKVASVRSCKRGRTSSPEFLSKILSPGEFFGVTSVIKGCSQAATVRALKASEVYIFSKDFVVDLMRNQSASLLKSLFSQLVRDLEVCEANDQLHYLASVQERIAYQLSILAEKFGVPSPQGLRVNLRLTRNELAQLAGTINESLSRHLTELKSEGLLEINGREIIVRDLEKLKAKSGNFGKSA
jgi:CRP/FNR family cyclic AMP-dependent transcriptional regulator